MSKTSLSGWALVDGTAIVFIGMKRVNPSNFAGRKVAILTSGGDAQGMNSAIRGASRMVLSLGAHVYAVKWGYQGLVDGGSNIYQLHWHDLSGIIHFGGTILGSARCADFETYDGRQVAAYNMVTLGINHLIVIGGDGSLTGANKFKSEWPNHLKDLYEKKKINEEMCSQYEHLFIVGMVGSIDNDFCGVEMTIGADSALHRITECVDSIITTAKSHQRAFVLEVMGRHSGYLALMSGIATGADFVFTPEWPPVGEWRETLCKVVSKARAQGKVHSIIIIAEGASDDKGNPIKSDDVKKALTHCLALDVRVTILGHVQRGGSPSAFDRILACRSGMEAAINVLVASSDEPSYVIGTQGNKIVRNILEKCVEDCNKIKEAYKNNDVSAVVKLRGTSFERNLRLFKMLKKCSPPLPLSVEKEKFGVMLVGAPCSGSGSCIRAFVRYCLSSGHPVVGIRNGFTGLINNDIIDLSWHAVESWFTSDNGVLGTSRTHISTNVMKIANNIKERNIKGIMMVGGFDGFECLVQIEKFRKDFDSLCIPFVLVPATMSNNVPGTRFSIGGDTTINFVMECCDRLRESSIVAKNKIFVVETMGRKCGYIATMAALAGAADSAYIFEEPYTLNDIVCDVNNLKRKFSVNGLNCGIMLVADQSHSYYRGEFINTVFNGEAEGLFISTHLVLGHIQQGGSASPFDRVLGSKYGVKCGDHFVNLYSDGVNNREFSDSSSLCVLGLLDSGYKFTSVQELLQDTDIENRIWKNQWWCSFRPSLRVMSDSTYVYVSESRPDITLTNIIEN